MDRLHKEGKQATHEKCEWKVSEKKQNSLSLCEEMASLKVPEVVPSPTQDSQRLRKAVQGLSLPLSLSHTQALTSKLEIDEFKTIVSGN